MALSIDTASINADAGGGDEHALPPPPSPEAEMEDLALSPMVDASDSLIPLSMTDSASGSRPLPSLNGPITYRDVPFIGVYVAHALFTLVATNAIRRDGDAAADGKQESDDAEDGAGGAGRMLRDAAVAVMTAVSDGETTKLNASDIGVALRSLCVINILFGVGWLLLFFFYSKMRFLQGSCAFSTVGLLVLAVVLLSMDNGDALFLGVVVTLTVVMDLTWMIKTKSGLDFVAVLFELVVDFLLGHPSLAAVTMGILVVYTIWASWLCTTIAFVGEGVSPWSFSMLYLYLHFYWTSNILKNILTVVVSGTTMIWYYRDDSSEVSPGTLDQENVSDHDSPSDHQDGQQNSSDSDGGSLFAAGYGANMDRRVVGHFLKSALSSSFGSVCIGSLLCPLAHVIWNIVRWARRDESVLSRRFGSRLRSEHVDHFIRTYHKYSFVHIAGYGKPFYVAAQDAWALIEARGVEAIVDDDPTSRLLLLGANGWASVMCAMCISALSSSGHAVFFGLASFTLCYTTLSIATNVVAAVIKTLFVCFAEHPSRLSQLNPLIYHRFVRLSELKSFRDHKAPPATARSMA